MLKLKRNNPLIKPKTNEKERYTTVTTSTMSDEDIKRYGPYDPTKPLKQHRHIYGGGNDIA